MKRHFFLIPAFIAMLTLGSFAPGLAADYVVDDGDVLQITVYDHNDLTTTVRVSGDGTIIFPLLGQLMVVGKTIPQISKIISAQLADGYIINPQVNVFITQFRNQNIFVNGQVKKPGVIQFEEGMTLIKVISLAGGFTEEADENLINISRRQNDKEVILAKPDLSSTIQPGDVIIVPEEIKAQDIFVSGQVKKPGSFAYDRDHEMTLIKVISLAGGFTDLAAKEKTSIVRRVNGAEITIEKAKLNEPIRPGDVIIVPESFF
ncbi:MAG: polysaccharide export protein [Proteobacteria bacterium]|nr:polysaccharide export protein [Pseudomonadota bacterium]MBU1688209.1 polysaccharide export protein [Pseudomonadota bacterium]